MDYLELLNNWHTEVNEHSILFLYTMGELCNIYIYVNYLFYGYIMYKLPIEGQKEVEYEKMIEEPSRAATLLP